MLARICDFAVLYTVKSKNANFYGKAIGFAKILPKGKRFTSYFLYKIKALSETLRYDCSINPGGKSYLK